MQKELAWVPCEWGGILHSSVVVLVYCLAQYRMLLLLLICFQCACVFSASVQPPAIQALLPCFNLMLACNHLFCFSYPFPKRLRHFFLFLSYHLCFPYTYSKFSTIIIQCATTVWFTATISEQSFLELLRKHKYSLKRVFWHLGISWLLTCSLRHTTWSCYHDALFPVSLRAEGKLQSFIP